jgi:hypothetical protein
VEVELAGFTFVFHGESYLRYVELISRDGSWRAEVRTDRQSSRKFSHVLNVSIASPKGRAYLSLETNEEDALDLLWALKRAPKNEDDATNRARAIMEAMREPVGSILGPVLSP